MRALVPLLATLVLVACGDTSQQPAANPDPPAPAPLPEPYVPTEDFLANLRNEDADGCYDAYQHHVCLEPSVEWTCDDIRSDRLPIPIATDDPLQLDADFDGLGCDLP